MCKQFFILLLPCLFSFQTLLAGINNYVDTSIRCSASLGITGDPADVKAKTESVFLLAGGSKDVDAAMQWFLEGSGGGDVVIIRASGSTGYNDYLYKLGKVNSLETLLINSRELAMNDTVIQIVRNAEALFIAGGDQWNYTRYWMGTPLNDAINYLINEKKVPVGGTSAGLAILGEYFFDAKNGSITSKEALQNPFDEKMSINRGFVKIKWLKDLITDSHYAQREREGRHIVMLARIKAQYGRNARGLGIDENTAVAIDKKGKLFIYGTNRAWFLETTKGDPEVLNPGKSNTVSAYTITGSDTGTSGGNIKKFRKLTGGSKGYFNVKQGTLEYHEPAKQTPAK